MKVGAVRSVILGGIKAVKDVVRGEEAQNPFRYVKIEAEAGADGKEPGTVVLTGSDGDIQVRSTVRCRVDEPGAVSIAGSMLTPFVGALAEGMVSLTHGAGHKKAHLEGGRTRYAMSTGTAEDFPLMKTPDPEKLASFTLPAPTLRELFRKTRYAVSTDKTRASLGGVNMCLEHGTLCLVATDGRRLACASWSGDHERADAFNVTVPARSVQQVEKLLGVWKDGDVRIGTDGQVAVFAADLWNVSTKLVESPYPNWHRVVPQNATTEIRVERGLFLAELARAGVATWSGAETVKITFGSSRIVFEARTGESSARGEMPCKYDGADIAFLFNPELLRQSIDAFDDDEVSFWASTGQAPVVVRSNLPAYAVVMPLREN